MQTKNKATPEQKAVSTDAFLNDLPQLDPTGKIVTCVTATFGYRGKLLAITPDFYILGQPLVKLISYGQMDRYSKGSNSNAVNGERPLEGVSYVERSGNIALEISPAWQIP